MAKTQLEVIDALRKTAEKIELSPDYQWGHMGSCNCGFLAQHITKHTKQQIHRSAMERYGDWNEQLSDYCPTSGLKMDDLISDMINFGFDVDDLRHLERLSDPKVLQTLPPHQRNLRQNVKADVIIYMRQWADLLESTLLRDISITSLRHAVEAHTESNLSR